MITLTHFLILAALLFLIGVVGIFFQVVVVVVVVVVDVCVWWRWQWGV